MSFRITCPEIHADRLSYSFRNPRTELRMPPTSRLPERVVPTRFPASVVTTPTTLVSDFTMPGAERPFSSEVKLPTPPFRTPWMTDEDAPVYRPPVRLPTTDPTSARISPTTGMEPEAVAVPLVASPTRPSTRPTMFVRLPRALSALSLPAKVVLRFVIPPVISVTMLRAPPLPALVRMLVATDSTSPMTLLTESASRTIPTSERREPTTGRSRSPPSRPVLHSWLVLYQKVQESCETYKLDSCRSWTGASALATGVAETGTE